MRKMLFFVLMMILCATFVLGQEKYCCCGPTTSSCSICTLKTHDTCDATSAALNPPLEECLDEQEFDTCTPDPCGIPPEGPEFLDSRLIIAVIAVVGIVAVAYLIKKQK